MPVWNISTANCYFQGTVEWGEECVWMLTNEKDLVL